MSEHDGHEVQPIIIKRRKHGGHGHHGGAWKVALADFMTAMMAFFMVMWLVGQKAEVRESVAGYFRDPGKFAQQGKSGVLKGSSSPLKPSSLADPIVPPPTKADGGGPSMKESEQLTLTARRILEALKNQPAFERVKKNMKVQMTSEGLRIILNESENSPAFFEPGSAKLLQKSAIILVTIAKELGNLQNNIVIEGHTNSRPTASKEYTNWELSTDRANAARQLMEVSGLFQGQIKEVRGFAGEYPMVVNNPDDPRNRRVTILVLYTARMRQVDQIQVGADLMADL